MNILQATEPHWFGDHAWILPVSFVVLCVGLLVWLCQYDWMQRLLGIRVSTPVDQNALTREIERIAEKVITDRGLKIEAAVEPPRTAELPEQAKEPPENPLIFDGELFRIVTAPKSPVADMTKQIMRGMKQEFVIDVDVLVEMYIVNVSSESQYLRDFRASVEIDGERIDLIRQNDFDAWEFDDREFEYCLDPAPEEDKFDLDARAQALQAVFPSMPVELGPRRPLEGWVRFLLKETDPEKLEENRTYQFVLVDSLGRDHPITKAVHRDASKRTRIKSRRKGGGRR